MSVSPRPDATQFDPLGVALHGLHLVEASAGTGKTWSIISLLLRAVALDGRAIDSMIVVTFTRAATRELRERLRTRLQQALDAASAGAGDDAFLQALFAATRECGISAATLRQRLQDALVRCDEAWVETIHGLCARWLRDFAFEQRIALEPWPVDEGNALRQRACADVWRHHVVLADAGQAGRLLALFGNSEGLLARLQPLLAVDPQQVDGADAEAAYPALLAGEAQLRRDLARLWHDGDFAALWAHLEDGKRYSRTQLSDVHRQRALDCLQQAALGDTMPTADALARVCSDALRRARNKAYAKEPIPDLAALRWIDDWLALLVERAQLEPVVWLHRLRAAVAAREAELQARERRQSFDDLVRKVRHRLRGAIGERFAAQLAARFPLAVVDEFQDTDADQYAIFRAIYHGRPQAGLFLVGDPKQSIYRFRGGDVFAYRTAMQDADQQHRLQYNRRSEPAAVDAVNALFGGRSTPFVFEFIDFSPARMPPEAADRRPDGNAATVTAGLTVWRLPDADAPLGQRAAEVAMHEAVASEIAALIESGVAPPGERAPIAVLLGTHAQARGMRKALARWGVACAYAGEGSVFASDAARDLLDVLAALAAPRNLALQRRVLAGAVFELAAVELVDASSPQLREAGEALLAAARLAGRRGPAAGLLPLIARAAPIRLQRVDGRRWLGDALHLLDLLGAQWPDVEGLDGLARWLQQAIADTRDSAVRPADEHRLRPESDHAQVRLMTVHGSKGLEFDYVFAPFLWQGVGEKVSDGASSPPKAVAWHTDQGELRIDPGTPAWPAHAAENAREAFAEAVRLAYVALTRARRRSWIAFGATRHRNAEKSSLHSPLAWLLDPERQPEHAGRIGDAAPAALSSEAVDAALARWQQRSAGAVSVEPLPLGIEPRRLQPPPSADVPAPRRCSADLSPSRSVYSYSGLFGGLGAHAERPDHDAPAATVAPVDDDVAIAPEGIGGSRFGECVHAALEAIDFSRWPDADGATAVALACTRFGFGDAARQYIEQRVDVLCQAPLIDGLVLGQVSAADRLAELEFFFPLQAARIDALGRLLGADRLGPRDAEFLRSTLRGFMRGFVDLVVRWRQRYYVLDYKTNLLGSSLDDYLPDALALAVRRSGYDLQYLLYTLAVHRHLRARLGAGYDYARQFGGVCYVYLRGLDGSGTRGVFVDRPTAALVDELDRWADGATSGVAA